MNYCSTVTQLTLQQTTGYSTVNLCKKILNDSFPSAVLHVRICLYNTVIYEHIRLCTYSSYIRPSLGVRIENDCSYMSVYQLEIQTIYVRICTYIRTIYIRIWNDYTATQNHIRTQPYMLVYCSYKSV